MGGTKYRTTLSTLTKYPNSMLGVMFSGRHDLPQQEDGSYFIDRDGGEGFSYLMSYLRDSFTYYEDYYAIDDHEPTAPSVYPYGKKQKQIKVARTDEVLNQLSSEARLLHTKVAYEAELKGSMHTYTDA